MVSDAPPKKPAWSSLWRWALSIVLLGIVGYRLSASWGELRRHPPSFSWGWGCASFAALMVFLVICSEAWRRWVNALGERMRATDAFRIMFVTNLAKYLPGGVWSLVGQVALCQREGMAPLPISLSILLEMACQIGGATLAALPTLSVLIAGSSSKTQWLARPELMFVAAVVLVGAMHPRVMNIALGLAAKVTKRDIPRITVRYRFILAMLAVYTLNWAFLALAFSALGQAILPTPMTSTQLLALIGAFLISYNAGVFAFFLPAGLGVREVALVVLLSDLFPSGWPATLALVARLWILVGEVVAFGIALLLRRTEEEKIPVADT